jgi:opacity protein-like surface antigen
MITRKPTFAFFLSFAVLLGSGSVALRAQVAPTAFKSPISLSVGGMGSVFNPYYISNKLGGVGAYVDVNLFHGIGIEAEGRWQRFHEFEGISQDNYLIGPRVRLKHIWRATPYVKVLGGYSHMNFEDNIATGRFTTIAFGGGVDIHLTHRWTVRPIDIEYQYWPDFLGDSLTPHGVSAGVSYRIF